MRDDLLALLEEKPYTVQELVSLLRVNWFTVRDQVGYLAATGHVTLGRRGRHMLVSLAPPPTAIKAPIRMPLRAGSRQGGRRPRAADLDRALGVIDPVAGLRVCAAAACGTRFTPDREAETYCSEKCRALGPAPHVRTVVVDGQAFEAISVGSRPVTGDWATGSTLADVSFVAPRRRMTE